MEERSISIPQFVESRSIQIANFLKSLADKALAKRSYQALPKTIRRRAMSHNRYRIPSRLRTSMNQQLKLVESTQKTPRCRRNIRRRPLLYKAYKQRDARCRWLETHLWSVKRMRMQEYFGYKVALTPNDKSMRACYRFANYSCCLQDMSFYEIMVVEFADEDSLVKTLKLHIDSELQLNNQYTSAHFLNNQKQIICPVLVFPGPTKTSAFILYHPAASTQFQQIQLQSCTKKTIYKNKIQLFRLTGPESLVRVSELVKQMGVETSNNQALKNLVSEKNPSHFRKHEIITVLERNTLTNNLKNRMISQPGRLYTNYIRTESNHLTYNQALRQRLTQQVKAYNSTLNSVPIISTLSFWDQIDKQPANQPKFQVVTRSRYTHKRNKANKQDKQKILDEAYKIKQEKLAAYTAKNALMFEQALQKDQPKYQDHKHPPKIVEQTVQVTLVETTTPSKTKIPVESALEKSQGNMVVAMANDNNKLDGCYILLNGFQHNYVWRKLVFLNCKPIGIRDSRVTNTENGIKTYPEDYPSTQGYAKNLKLLVDERVAKFKRRPPSKTANYKVIHSPFPMGSSFASLTKQPFDQTFVAVRCVMVGRGTMPEGSYICLPEEGDLQTFKHLLLEGGSVTQILQEEPEAAMAIEPELNHNFSSMTEEELKKLKLKQEKELRKLDTPSLLKAFKRNMTSRRIIGFITSGGYSLQRSKGYGIGYILKGFDQYQYLLVRKPTSVYYFMASVHRQK